MSGPSATPQPSGGSPPKARPGATPERLALARQAAALRDSGRSLREITSILSVSRSYASALLTDPDGSKARARKDRYAQPCELCGAPTSGCEGKREHPRCRKCGDLAMAAKKTIWPADLVLERIREWCSIYGEPPAVPDWGPTVARNLGDETRARRFEDADGYWPWFTNVVNRFGSWNEAIRAAGFEPRAAHGGSGNQARRRSVRARAAA